MSLGRWAVLAASGGLAVLATAAMADPVVFAERGGWEITRNDNDGCAMAMEYEGPGSTSLVLLKRVDGSLGIGIQNTNWSAAEGAEYEIAFVLDGQVFSGGSAIGYGDYSRRGFVIRVNPSFEQHFARGSTLHVLLDEEPIDELSLDGTAVALDVVNRCLGRVRADLAAAAREKARWEHLPEDPFARPPAAQPSGVAVPPKPIGNMVGWINSNDYPALALREQREGSVAFEVAVGPDGRPTGCRVTASSGSADLDAAACSLMMRRAKFIPARDENGGPTSGVWSSATNFELPN